MNSGSTNSMANPSSSVAFKSTLEGIYNLDGYLKKSPPIFKEQGEKKYRIDQYQGCHADEYTVYELCKEKSSEDQDRDGLAQHFKKGVIQLSWQMKSGVRSGALTVYVNGVVERMTSWSSIRNLDRKQNGMKSTENLEDDSIVYGEVQNERGVGHVLVERDLSTDVIIYRGGYNPLSLRREGYGICYDSTNGVEKSYGYYLDGDLHHIIQEFVNENDLNGNENGKKREEIERNSCNNTSETILEVKESGKKEDKMDRTKLIMIEYGGDVKEDNVELLFNRKPVYIGGYLKKDEVSYQSENMVISSPYVRHGQGYVMNDMSGVCDHESEWCKGVEKSESINQLYGGWYDNKNECDESINIRMIDRKEKERMEKERMEKERMEKEEAERALWLSEEITICREMNLMRCRGIEELIIGDNQFDGNVSNEVSFQLQDLPCIKRLSIGSCNFQKIRGFIMKNLPSIELVTIGNECFRITREWTGQWNTERQDGMFSISNCPNLTELVIGDSSFTDFKTFSISTVDSLKSIVFGEETFIFADCILKDLPSLEIITFKYRSFVCLHNSELVNLPKLHTITYDNGFAVMHGHYDNNDQATINGHSSYKNKLTMRNLPVLTLIKCSGDCTNIFYDTGYVILENIPNLKLNNIQYGNGAFQYTADLQATNANDFAQFIRSKSQYLH